MIAFLMSWRPQTQARSSQTRIKLRRGIQTRLPTTPSELLPFLPSGKRRPRTQARTPRDCSQGPACPS
eukprot:1265486-Alexandrium_andersonii.AAC.1